MAGVFLGTEPNSARDEVRKRAKSAAAERHRVLTTDIGGIIPRFAATSLAPNPQVHQSLRSMQLGSHVTLTGLAVVLFAWVPFAQAAEDATEPGIKRSFAPRSTTSGNQIFPRPSTPWIQAGTTRLHITWMTGEVENVPVDQLIAELAALPNWAWPEGRMVVLTGLGGLQRRGNRAQLEATYRAVKSLLSRHGFEIREPAT